MNRHDISIATMTWARDEQEEQLLREAIPLLAEAGLPTFIADGGSGKEFISFLQSFPTFTVVEAHRPGVFAQLRLSIQAAEKATTGYILYTEPDKKIFFNQKLNRFINAVPDGEVKSIFLSSRSEQSFATFPDFQKFTESVINRLCAEVVGSPGDYTYGPFLLSRELVGFLNGLADGIGWGWRPYIFGVAARLGYRFLHLEDDLSCPHEQRTDSPQERIYRMRQLSESIDGLVLSTSVATHA